MSSYIAQPKVLCETDNFILLGILEIGRISLDLRIQHFDSARKEFIVTKMFTKKVLFGLHPDLKEHFNTLLEVVQHLTNHSNFDIDGLYGIIFVKKTDKSTNFPKVVAKIMLEEKQLHYQTPNAGGKKLTANLKRFHKDSDSSDLESVAEKPNLWKI